MASLIAPYSTTFFNQVPDLHSSLSSFLSNGGMRIVDTIFKPLILRHRVEKIFGIGLLHRHFILTGREKLVEFNNISVPWKHQTDEDEHSGGKILPCGWAVVEEKLMPYEFYFSPLRAQGDLDYNAVEPFLVEFLETVKATGLERTLSLRLFPGERYVGGLEITEGRANVNFLPHEVPEDEWVGTTETMWFFDPRWIKEKRACRCKEFSGNPHMHLN
ncbi:hypothetical protein VTO42DRAFT_8259 [Malbranchea cinnamomea]